MGNIGSTGGNDRRRQVSRRTHPPTPPPTMPQPETTSSSYVFAAASPYPSHYPNPNSPHYYPHPGYYQPPPPNMLMPLQNPYDHHHQAHVNRLPGQYPYVPPVMTNHIPFVDQKAVTIRNDVNLKKETLRIEPDEEHPGRFLVAFTFDATVDGSITIFFFGEEGEGCNITPTKESLPPPVTVNFQQGLGQKFRQPSGTGINISMLEESESLKVGESDVYPLVVKAKASSVKQDLSNKVTTPDIPNSQITLAVFEKDKGEHLVKVVKQILWVNKMRYELQEIYGIGNSIENDIDGSDVGKECVICLSEPCDTTVLPCRHMCMCSGCAKMWGQQANRCPICRQPVERLLEIKVNNKPEE